MEVILIRVTVIGMLLARTLLALLLKRHFLTLSLPFIPPPQKLRGIIVAVTI